MIYYSSHKQCTKIAVWTNIQDLKLHILSLQNMKLWILQWLWPFFQLTMCQLASDEVGVGFQTRRLRFNFIKMYYIGLSRTSWVFIKENPQFQSRLIPGVIKKREKTLLGNLWRGGSRTTARGEARRVSIIYT